MRTLLHTTEDLTIREHRMLSMSFERQEPMNQPQIPRSPELTKECTSEEIMSIVSDRIDELRQKTDDTALGQIQKIVSTAQRDIDAIKSSPGVSKQFVREYLDRMNDTLHGRELHVSMLNENVIVTPHHPQQFSPEIAIRRNRMNQIREQIKHVGLAIARISRGRRGRPVFNRPNFAQSNLAQLYALRFQLEQQLIDMKNAPISEPIPLENPVMTFDPNYPPDQIRHVSYTAAHSPNPQPEQIPLGKEVPKASVQRDILYWSKRWKESKNKQDQDMTEGFLMMSGVDIDSSDLTTDKIVMTKSEERAGQAFAGLLKILKSLMDRLGKQKTMIAGEKIAEKDPIDMTAQEQRDEIRSNTSKIFELRFKKNTIENEMKGIKEKLAATQEPGDAKTKLEDELRQKKEAVKKIEAEMKRFEERNKALSQSVPKTEDEKGILKQGELLEDPVFKRFQSAKEAQKQKIRTSMKQILTQRDRAKNLENLGKVLGITVGADTEKTMTDLTRFLETIIDGASLEKNGDGLYRIAVDTTKIVDAMKSMKLLPKTEITASDVSTLLKNIGMTTNIAGSSVRTPFMKADELLKGDLGIVLGNDGNNTQEPQKDAAKNEPENITTPAADTPNTVEDLPTPAKAEETEDRAKAEKEAGEGLETTLGNLAMQIGVRSIANFNRTENVKVRAVLPKILAAVQKISTTEDQKAVLKTLSIAIVPNRSSGEPINQNMIELTTDQSQDEIRAIIEEAIKKNTPQ